MRLKVNFGLIEARQIEWWQPLSNFPTIVKFLNRNYEWVTWDSDLTGKVDYILTFSELQTYDPNYGVVCQVWSDLFKDEVNGCECGAKSPQDGHMFFCKLWRKW